MAFIAAGVIGGLFGLADKAMDGKNQVDNINAQAKAQLESQQEANRHAMQSQSSHQNHVECMKEKERSIRQDQHKHEDTIHHRDTNFKSFALTSTIKHEEKKMGAHYQDTKEKRNWATGCLERGYQEKREQRQQETNMKIFDMTMHHFDHQHQITRDKMWYNNAGQERAHQKDCQESSQNHQKEMKVLSNNHDQTMALERHRHAETMLDKTNANHQNERIHQQTMQAAEHIHQKGMLKLQTEREEKFYNFQNTQTKLQNEQIDRSEKNFITLQNNQQTHFEKMAQQSDQHNQAMKQLHNDGKKEENRHKEKCQEVQVKEKEMLINHEANIKKIEADKETEKARIAAEVEKSKYESDCKAKTTIEVAAREENQKKLSSSTEFITNANQLMQGSPELQNNKLFIESYLVMVQIAKSADQQLSCGRELAKTQN